MTIRLKSCEHCGKQVPEIEMTDLAWTAIGRLGGRPAMAAAELVALELANKADAIATVEHLRSCVFSWPASETLKPVLEVIDAEFGGTPKPDHFTDFQHCSECREHDETLRSKMVQTISRRDLGNQGWHPISFCSVEGLAYYFPALARLAAIPALSEDQDGYASMLVPILIRDRTNNPFFEYCNPRQRIAVAYLLEWLAENERQLQDFLGDWSSWADGAEVWRTNSD